jgi:hypothetical protein
MLDRQLLVAVVLDLHRRHAHLAVGAGERAAPEEKGEEQRQRAPSGGA